MKPEKPVKPRMGAARRLRIFTRDGGVCEICRCKVQAGEPYDIDHRIPWALAFNDADENLRTVHKTCHRELKTGPDMSRIAKAKAQGGETGQRARREKRGHGSIPSRPFQKPTEKKTWPKRPWGKNEKDR
jgi:5-methylcytosine-specific restriction protein A